MTDENITFSPDNEPYIGKELLYHFDQIICSLMAANMESSKISHRKELNDLEAMASQVIAQSTSLILSIRELIRQGYLFGAKVLVRSTVERITILHYLHHYPEKVSCWNDGWEHGKAPSLAKMFEAIQEKQNVGQIVKGYELTKVMNSLSHGKPDSVTWNLVSLGKGKVGHSVSKIMDRPDLCDEICADIIPWIAVLLGMIVFYFPPDTQENRPSPDFKDRPSR